MHDDYYHIAAWKDIKFPGPTTEPFKFNWEYGGVVYKVQVLYEKCETTLYDKPDLPKGLVLKGHIKGSHT